MHFELGRNATTDRPTARRNLVVGTLLLGCLLSGCSWSSNAPEPTRSSGVDASAGVPELLSFSEMQSEYATVAENFPEALPPGVKFPADIPNAYEEDALSEPGVGAGIAYFYWMCAWQENFIDAHAAADSVAQEEALTVLERWKMTDFYRDHFDDPDDLWTKSMIAPARAGDPRELIEAYQNGCGFYIANNP